MKELQESKESKELKELKGVEEVKETKESKEENEVKVDPLVLLDLLACLVNQDHLVFKAHLERLANVETRVLKDTEA